MKLWKEFKELGPDKMGLIEASKIPAWRDKIGYGNNEAFKQKVMNNIEKAIK